MCPSGVSPSEARGPKPPVKASLNPFLLDLSGLPNPVLGAPLVQGKHLLLIPCFSYVGDYLFSTSWSWVWQGSRKERGFGHHLPKKGLFHVFLYVSAGASEREVAMWNRVGVSPLCFAALCSCPS